MVVFTRSTRRLFILGLFIFLGLFVCLIFYIINYTIAKVRCGYFFVPFDSDFYIELDKNEVASDIAYAKALSANRPVRVEISDKNFRNLKHQYQKIKEGRSFILNDRRPFNWLTEVYVPQFNCPYEAPFGALNGGWYFVCNPWMLAKSEDGCVVYSVGVNQGAEFEQEIYEAANGKCDIFCFDHQEKSEDIFLPFRGKFVKATISTRSDPTRNRYTLNDFTNKFNHKKLDILQIDLGGTEFNILPQFLREYNGTVCQLLVEFHTVRAVDLKPWLRNGKHWVRLFQMLERRGFRLFYREVKTSPPFGYKYSYVHISCFEKFGLNESSVIFNFFE